MKYIVIVFSLIMFSGVLFSCSQEKITQEAAVKQATVKVENIEKPLQSDSGESQLFFVDDLKTNTAKKSIPLEEILYGGVPKDGIPAINNPKFVSLSEAKKSMSYLGDESLGIAVEDGGFARFYSYAILYSHEIVNDELNGKKIAVTFCPLCGSAIVFDRQVGDKLLSFGVSGKLYNSNLLMYDDINESLWSQSLGEAVIGEDTGTVLKHIPSHVISFSQFQKNFPNGEVLSDDTGFVRNYGQSPYGNYETSNRLYFPVNGSIDRSFHKKEIFYIVKDGNDSLAFHLQDLVKEKKAEITIGKTRYEAVYKNGLVEVKKGENILPGYYEMWFSWSNNHPENKNIWSSKK